MFCQNSTVLLKPHFKIILFDNPHLNYYFQTIFDAPDMSALSLRNVPLRPEFKSVIPWNHDVQWDLVMNNYELSQETETLIENAKVNCIYSQLNLHLLSSLII